MNKVTFRAVIQPQGAAARRSEFVAVEMPRKQNEYGCGCYVDITRDGRDFAYVDARYMRGYTLQAAAADYLRDYFGANLKDLAITKGGRNEK